MWYFGDFIVAFAYEKVGSIIQALEVSPPVLPVVFLIRREV